MRFYISAFLLETFVGKHAPLFEFILGGKCLGQERKNIYTQLAVCTLRPKLRLGKKIIDTQITPMSLKKPM